MNATPNQKFEGRFGNGKVKALDAEPFKFLVQDNKSSIETVKGAFDGLDRKRLRLTAKRAREVTGLKPQLEPYSRQ